MHANYSYYFILFLNLDKMFKYVLFHNFKNLLEVLLFSNLVFMSNFLQWSFNRRLYLLVFRTKIEKKTSDFYLLIEA